VVTLPLFEQEEAPAGADVAYTPPRLARAIVQALQAEIGLGLTWEPHAGGGAFLQALTNEGIPWVASTLEPADSRTLSRRFRQEIPARDALLPCPWTPASVVGNPPFSNADEHVQAALEAVKTSPRWTVALLLPLSFACREKHAHLFPRSRSWGLWPISPRPTFTGPGREGAGTAMTDVGVYVFSSAPVPARVISW
jgi:hypothetical protein